ncbi:sensor histidine kinase [Curtobacterium sp. 260]|uniref:sensor histidine kinase n=1 Tax=Curtobacterium sp. 260 TaxID=2817748 RepID=UPI002783C9B4|nr:HAMP domain-containing sensor histidine kinase [Curtobacterium sp. 260]MDP9735529.1 two-component system sensor histidine kinase VanS [Curtobacterium sp. 260]
MTVRRRGASVRVRLALSYAGVVVLTGALILAVVWVFLLRYVPVGNLATTDGYVPDRSDLVRAFVPAAAAVSVGLVVVGLVGGWFLAGRVLAPLHRITEATRQVAAGSLAHRVALPGRRDEFRDLADAFDGMVGRLEAYVAEQQRFAANASHELRTPLATTRALLEVAAREPDRDPAGVLERLRNVNERAVDLTEALLVLARAGRELPDRERVDLSLLADEAVETVLPLAEARGIDVEPVTATAWTTGSTSLLLQLVTNLLQNAVVHNVGPGRDGWVRVTTGTRQGASVVVVENPGAVVPAAVVPTLTEPFQRVASRRREDDAGAGLGLAIVAAILTSHGGTLDVAARPEGGLVVEVALPAAASPAGPSSAA